jgi:hypothetical protein
VACRSGQSCVDNTCAQVGSPCATDEDCAPLGNFAICKRATNPYGDPYPGGYCTKLCGFSCPTDRAPAECRCPPSSRCTSGPRMRGENDSFCWKTCGNSGDCRDGYDCYLVATTSQGDINACWLSPLPTPDAGPPAPPGRMGGPCRADDECRNPPADGFCKSELDGFIGGSCSAPCDVSGDEHCGDGGRCVYYGLPIGAQCGSQCAAPNQGQSNCRAGYVCIALFGSDGGTLSTGLCNPNCNNPGYRCGARVCQADGYCR